MMRRASRSVCLLVALAVVVAACSKPKSESDTVGLGELEAPEVDEPVGADELETTDSTAADGADPTAPAASADPAQASGGGGAGGGDDISIGGTGDESQLRAVGARITPQTTERRKPYHPGVGEDTIKLIFSTDATSCGVNVVNALTAAGGALPSQERFYRAAPTTQDRVIAEVRESIEVMVRYWNDHAFQAAEYAPAVRSAMGNDPERPFYGRRLVHEVIDGGSNQCPDKTTAAAKLAIEKKAFIVYNNLEGASSAGAYNMAAALNAQPADRRPMHFGTLWLTDQDYARFAPYAWTQFSTGSTITRQYASWICSRVATGAVPPRAEMVTDPKKRVFGLVHTNLEQDRRLANELKGYLKQMCGIEPKEVEYDGTDFGKAQQDNPNLVVQLKLAGVTSVMMLTDPVQPLFQIQAAKQQDYRPEWIFSSFGYGDSNTVQRLYDQEMMRNSYGTSNLGIPGGFNFGVDDPFLMYHAYHKVAPSGKPCDPRTDEGMDHDPEFCKAPTALVTWYYTMLPSIGGILFAGPDLRPETVSAGLQNYPTTRYGRNGPTSDPRPALVGAGKDKYGFIVDAVEWRWRPDFTSPEPEAEEGWVEYPDCQRHYLLWPNTLAPNWEKDGPHYNAWCGDENGYPRILPEDSQV